MLKRERKRECRTTPSAKLIDIIPPDNQEDPPALAERLNILTPNIRLTDKEIIRLIRGLVGKPQSADQFMEDAVREAIRRTFG